jgi:hypothetical protein
MNDGRAVMTDPTTGALGVVPGGELDRVIAWAARGPILVERNGRVYRITIEPETSEAEPDPAVIERMLDSVAGSWASLDVDTAMHFVSQARARGSRSSERP